MPPCSARTRYIQHLAIEYRILGGGLPRAIRLRAVDHLGQARLGQHGRHLRHCEAQAFTLGLESNTHAILSHDVISCRMALAEAAHLTETSKYIQF